MRSFGFAQLRNLSVNGFLGFANLDFANARRRHIARRVEIEEGCQDIFTVAALHRENGVVNSTRRDQNREVNDWTRVRMGNLRSVRWMSALVLEQKDPCIDPSGNVEGDPNFSSGAA